MNPYILWLRIKVALLSLEQIALGAILDALRAPNYKAEKWTPPLIVAAGMVVYYWLI